MRIGDIVSYQDRLWRVLRRNPSTRTVIVEQWDGTSTELPDDAEETQIEPVTVVCNPSKDWPFVATPAKPTAGPIEEVTLMRHGNRRTLEPMVDWVPIDRTESGRTLFFHPDLNLRKGEVLSARHKDGSRTRISVTRSFGTVKRRVARKEAKKLPHRPPNTIYSRLMGEDKYED